MNQTILENIKNINKNLKQIHPIPILDVLDGESTKAIRGPQTVIMVEDGRQMRSVENVVKKQLKEINKRIYKQAIRRDVRQHRNREIYETIDKDKSLKENSQVENIR